MTPKPFGRPMRGRRMPVLSSEGLPLRRATAGQSLIVAMVLLSFLTAIMGAMALGLRTETRFAGWQQDRLSAFYFARAGIEAAVNQLLIPSPGYDGVGAPWYDNETELGDARLGQGNAPLQPDEGHEGHYRVSYADETTGSRRAGIVDEERKLNINKAEPAMLQRLDPAFTDAIVKAIVERREKRPFAAVSELTGLPGVPPNFLTAQRENAKAGLGSLLTVWGEGKVNINTAPAAVLACLGPLDKTQAQKLVEFRRGAGAGPEKGAFKNLGEAPSLLGTSGETMRSLFTTSSSHFSIASVGYFSDDPTLTCELKEVVRRGPEGLQVLRFEQLR